MLGTLSASLLYAGLSGIMLVALSVIVIRARVKHRVTLHDGGSAELGRAIRVHGNFTEYMPMFLILLGLAETASIVPVSIIHALGVTMLCGRIAHAVSLLVIEPAALQRGAMNIGMRQLGMLCTFTPLTLVSLVCLWHACMG